MIKQFLFIILVAVLPGVFGCNSNTNDKGLQTQTNSPRMKITVETLKQILDAFNRHDLDAIMEYFSDDCSFDFPRGPEPMGNASRVKPRCGRHLQAASKEFRMFIMVKTVIGSQAIEGVSEWTLTGTTTSGIHLKVRGCDLWEFRDGKITRKDSYWKIVEP